MNRFETDVEYIELLSKASDAYYNSDEPIISDHEFDVLREEFEMLYPNHKYLKEVGSKPTMASFKKIKHLISMGSQSKVNSFDELSNWIKNSENKLKEKINSFVVSEKIDGFSLSIDYEKTIKMSVTRGDGVIGEDVTNNVKKMIGVLREIPDNRKITVRGESVLTKTLFSKHFKDKKNARNAGAGTVRRLDGDGCEHLTFLAFDIIIDGESFSSEIQKLTLLDKMGFNTPKFKVCSSIDEVEKYYIDANKSREDQDYEMDGLVVTIDSTAHQEKLGIIDQRPRYSRAYKFTSQTGISTVLSIDFFAGRTGRITPVAKITPTFLGGVTIQNVTLHNISEMKRLGVSIGSEIELKRAGDVIPKIERVLSNKNENFKFPDKCPSCGEKTTESDKFLMCYNQDCEAKHYESLLHWVKTLDIKGFGEELVNQLNLAGQLTSQVDFYKLNVTDIATLAGRGEKSAVKVLNELNSKRSISYPLFIKALGILNFSDKTAELVQPYYTDVVALLNATEEDLIKIHGIGDSVAKAIVCGMKSKRKIIGELMEYISIAEYKKKDGLGKLSGKTFCFTGIRDKDLESSINEAGGLIVSGVSKNLTYLVCKDSEENSSKLNKARELGIKIISIKEALDIFLCL